MRGIACCSILGPSINCSRSLTGPSLARYRLLTTHSITQVLHLRRIDAMTSAHSSYGFQKVRIPWIPGRASLIGIQRAPGLSEHTPIQRYLPELKSFLSLATRIREFAQVRPLIPTL